MHGRPGPSVRRTVRGARRGPERACAGRRARLLPRPHLAETAAQWRRPWPLHVPSPTCSLTWTASCWVGSLRPPPARAVRGRRGRGGADPQGRGPRRGRVRDPRASGGSAMATPGLPRAGLRRRRCPRHLLPAAAPRVGDGMRGGGARCSGTTARTGAFPPASGGRGPQFPRLYPGRRPAPRCTHLARSILQGMVLHPPIWGHLPTSGGVWGDLARGYELLASGG